MNLVFLALVNAEYSLAVLFNKMAFWAKSFLGIQLELRQPIDKASLFSFERGEVYGLRFRQLFVNFA